MIFEWIVMSHGKWDKYYENKLRQPPQQIVKQAINLFESAG